MTALRYSSSSPLAGSPASIWRKTERPTTPSRSNGWRCLRKTAPDSDEDWSSRFERECKLQRVASGVSGVPAYLGHSVSSSERPWLALEFINGPSLHERVVGNRRRMNDRDVAVFSHQLFTTLSAIHKRGVVHRDLHPANILLGPGIGPYLVDFGISFHEQADRITKTALNIGSLGYRSPERIRATRSHQRASHVQRQRFLNKRPRHRLTGGRLAVWSHSRCSGSTFLPAKKKRFGTAAARWVAIEPPRCGGHVFATQPSSHRNRDPAGPASRRSTASAGRALGAGPASASGGVSNPLKPVRRRSDRGRDEGRARSAGALRFLRFALSNPRARSETAELGTEAAPIEEYADGHATDERAAADHNLPPERPPIPRSSRQRGEVASPPPVRPSAIESMPSDVARIESAGVLSDSREVGQTPQGLAKRHSPSSDRPGGRQRLRPHELPRWPIGPATKQRGGAPRACRSGGARAPDAGRVPLL
ncbi:MAG: protein kinase [Acidimicrobiia bacterium]|nr:protein kinase [Acidimicrobiia bacterium]